MFGFIMMILAIWLFLKFIGLILRLSWGLMKGLFIVLAIVLWPISLGLLATFGLVIIALPVILVCGICYLIGKALAN